VARSIVHLDADAFFVSVEQAADSRLRGKPVAVGGGQRGIIASASYEARKMGVYTPMPTVRARQLCPRLIVLPGDYERYEQFSRWMFAYAFDFTGEVEVTGIDEGYFDLSGARQAPREIAETIRQAINQKLKISVSEGIATSKLVSQIASKCRKPAGFVEVPPGMELDFLHPLPNKWLPGIGPKTAARLDAAGLRDIRHLAHTPPELLELLLGSQAASVRAFANGIDDRPLILSKEAPKSFGEQETFTADLTDEDYIEAVLRRMADRLFAKVREEGKCIRTVTVKVRYNDMAEDQRSESLPEPTDLETDLYSRLRPLLHQAWKRRVSLRLVSLKLSNLYAGHRQAELFLDDRPDLNPARRNLARTVDALRREHGESVVLRAHDLRLREGPREAGAEATPTLPPRVPVRSYIKTAPLVKAVPLNVRSWYSFLDSTLSPQALIDLAVKHELPAIALADFGNLHGAPEFARLAQEAGIKPLIGAELRIGNHALLCYVQNACGYRNLCRILTNTGIGPDEESTAAAQRLPLKKERLHGLTDGLLAVSDDASLATLFPGRFYLAVSSARAAPSAGLPAVLAPRIHYHLPADRLKWNVMQSIRTRTLLQQPHADKRLQGAYHFRTPAEMNRLAGNAPVLLHHSRELADRCDFTFPFGPPQFPAWQPPDGQSARDYLHALVMRGLAWRYAARASRYEAQALEELAIIAEVGYEDYFLIVHDLLQDCRQAGIEWITRGSAADSLVCYCLGISGVCPIRFELYFKRFLNKDRMALQKLPDIDLDFPHDRKDDVVDLLFKKYGPGHCAAVGGFSTFQARGAVGEVGKVLGVSEYQIRRLTERFPSTFGGSPAPDGSPLDPAESLLAKLKSRPESAGLPLTEEPFRSAILIAAFLDGCPRYPKMHPCGIVLSREPMAELTPRFTSQKNYATSHYEMDAAEAMGLIKMDILAQGGLSVMRDASAALRARGIPVDLEALEPWDDPAVWAMIASGGARAVHHIESPAMCSLCGMTNVSQIDGLIAIVSVIRPGAANEAKKLRFTRRYQKMEPVEYPHPSLESCLRSTYGLVVYEEHILQISETFAGLSGGRADALRRALVKNKTALVAEISQEFHRSARARGHDESSITRVWDLVSSFKGYAFNKAHSTAYGVEAYQAAWLKRYHPAEFMAGVLTHGKGFYTPLVYVLECHRLGLRLLPPCINHPGPGFVVRDGAIRVPVSAIKGLSSQTLDRLLKIRQDRGPFSSLAAFHQAVRPSADELESLIRAGACDTLSLSRTRLFWEAQVCRRRQQDLTGAQGWLLPPPALDFSPTQPLPAEPSLHDRLTAEAELLGYTVSAHPLELHPRIAWDSYCPVARLHEFTGQTVVLCGLTVVSRTHRQANGESMKFLTLADRTGMIEAELFGTTYRRFGLATVRYPVLEVTATVEPFENGNGYSLHVHRAGKPRNA
jgi:DNA-directed DNA polymerase III PolC